MNPIGSGDQKPTQVNRLPPNDTHIARFIVDGNTKDDIYNVAVLANDDNDSFSDRVVKCIFGKCNKITVFSGFCTSLVVVTIQEKCQKLLF